MLKWKSRQKVAFAILFLVAITTLYACNYPGLRTASEPDAAQVYTAAAETVEAQLTPGIQISPTSGTPPLTATPPLAPTATIPGSTLPPPSATSQPPTATKTTACDLAKFVKDVTIPDDTQLEPGAVFQKTWRLQNAGSCTWTAAYTLVYEGDNKLNAPMAAPVTTGNVPPGGTIDISVTLTAPVSPGNYRQNFKLANAGDARFGLGDGTKPFWAQIEVGGTGGLVYDFLIQASQATWKSGVGNTFDTPLNFGGADDDPNGVAKIKDGVILETGLTSGKILLTYPKHSQNGAIAGAYPPYTVQQGDRLRARLGFMANQDGNCGAGDAKFRVLYIENSVANELGNWNKTCDGALLPINIDLSSLAGRNIQIVLMVRSNGDFQDDWAVWNSPRIER